MLLTQKLLFAQRVNQCHLVKPQELSLGLEDKYICRKLHEHVGT